ncbi:MAG: putative transposase [Magnetococcales bacterium]|nr:putative transposase [Magnetococcales bacterium]
MIPSIIVFFPIQEKKGEAKMLTRQLQRRFGVLPDWACAKIAEADLHALEEWSLRVLDATTLDGVFAEDE